MTDSPKSFKRPLTEARRKQLSEAGKKGSAAAKISNNKPARGGPPSGMPAAGPGWGGDANGPGRDLTAAENRGLPRANPLSDAEIAVEMRRKLYDLAHGAEYEQTQLAAASKLLDRIEGLPIARVQADVNTFAQVSDEPAPHVDQVAAWSAGVSAGGPAN